MSDIETPNQNSGCSEHPMDYLNKAAEACAAGDMTLGLHLYLAAYEKAVSEPGTSTGIAVAALREAWHLACDLKERSMAEHVFGKLEPYLTPDEISECAATLQDLALEHLEEYGFTREELQDMAEAISQDFLGADASVVKVEHITLPHVGMMGNAGIEGVHVETIRAETTNQATGANTPNTEGASAPTPTSTPTPAPDAPNPERGKELGMGVSKVFNPYDMFPESSEGKSWRSATNVGSGWNESVGLDGSTVFDSRFEGFSPVHASEPESSEETADEDAPASVADAQDENAGADKAVQPADSAEDAANASDLQPTYESQGILPPPGVRPSGPMPSPTADAPATQASANTPSMPQLTDVPALSGTTLNYSNLAGYDETVSIMRDYGFGLQADQGFMSFVNMLNEQHGLSRMPSADTMLFRAPAIEDAARFVDATIGELGLPVLRMSMEEGFQGVPVLCVTTDANNRPRMNRQQNKFQGPAILVLDDLDLWRMPEMPENVEGGGVNAFILANMTRGAREAVNLIHSAVEDPDVFVLATSSMNGEVQPFFYEVLEPLTIIDISNPNEKERAGMWSEIMRDHPSTRDLSLDDLVELSVGLARYDIYVAAREAVEEAYKQGLVQRAFVPVTPQNMFDKLAAMQPLDSDEYRALEERVVGEFVSGLDELESLLDNPSDLLGPRG